MMKPQLSITLFTALSLHALSAAADVTDGTVLALDRKSRTMVLVDRTVWSLDTMQSVLPAGLKAGDRIEIEYESDEEGVSAIRDIRILLPKEPAAGAPDITEGTILVFDRKENMLVLTDRTVWALESLKSSLPAGLKAGNRIKIEYESDEEGVSSINSIEIIPN